MKHNLKTNKQRWATALIMLGLLTLTSCLSENGQAAGEEETQVTLHITSENWIETANKSLHSNLLRDTPSNPMLYPINILLSNNNDVVKRIVVTNTNEFTLSVPSGKYQVYAICGLPTENIPSDITQPITIPNSENGQKDFALAKADLIVSNGLSSPATLNLNAQRQMAWLDILLTNVPSNITTLKLYIKEINETYTILDGWNISAAGRNRYIEIPMTKNGTTFQATRIIPPCANPNNIEFVVEAKTPSNQTTYFTYTSTTPLTSANHLSQTLEYADLIAIEGNINLGDWTTTTDDGQLIPGFTFAIGDQYFSHAATIVNLGTTQLLLWPHKAMNVTLAEVRSWEDKKRVPYSFLPDLAVSRWALPQSTVTPNNILGCLMNFGWDNFDEAVRSTGNVPLDRTKKNVIACYDPAKDMFYCYDFDNNNFAEVLDESGEFLLYPIGIVSLAQ